MMKCVEKFFVIKAIQDLFVPLKRRLAFLSAESMDCPIQSYNYKEQIYTGYEVDFLRPARAPPISVSCRSNTSLAPASL
jgi:hypothetical protein